MIGNEYLTETYVPYPFTLATNANFTLSDVSDLKATLTHIYDPSITRTWTKSAGEIIEQSGVLVVLIEKTDIKEAGHYDWRLVMTDQNTGKDRGLSLYPSRIIFK